MEMQHKHSELDKDYNKLKPKVNRLQRQCFSKNPGSKPWDEFHDARNKEHDLLRRNKPVLEYWTARERRGSS
jgi:hypothetical protein